MKTLEQIDAEIAKLQAERDLIVNGGFAVGDEIFCLCADGSIEEFPYDISYKPEARQGNVSESREWLEKLARRREIETQLLKYADWECESSVVLFLDEEEISFCRDCPGGQIFMSRESAERCLDEMDHDDLKFYLTWGQ
jgi:hypothetical protein